MIQCIENHYTGRYTLKPIFYKLFSGIVFIVLFVGFGYVLTIYTKPIENHIYDLSPISTQGDETTLDTLTPFDDHGWTIYTKENETISEIKPDEKNRLIGLSYLGQTFYYSRILTEELDSPTLQIGVANRTIAVFLDEQLIYTDCPELDNRIGYLTLPMLEQDRSKPITISLPTNYEGKTLTIAQSTPEISETFSSILAVYPCSVKLYCGYAYESSLIAENSQTSIVSSVLFCISILLLCIFVYKGFHNQLDISIICIALTILLRMVRILRHTTFFVSYFGVPTFDLSYYCNKLSFVVLLFFLCSKGKHYRKFLYGISILCLFSALLLMLYPSRQELRILPLFTIFSSLILIGFLLVLLFGFLFWRKETIFYRFFTPITLIGSVILFLIAFFSLEADTLIEKWNLMTKVYSIDFIITKLRTIMLIVGFVIVIAEFFSQEIKRQTKQQLLLEYSKLAQKNYEYLRQHQKQLMMLNHDINKHLSFLHQIAKEEKVSSYLEELLGQREQILPVIQSGNDMLDVILNSKLNSLYETNIKVEVNRTNAPEKFPLSDVDFCSLMINLMDNAILAVTKCEEKHPFLFLDLHIKNDFWVFTCKNSTSIKMKEKNNKKEIIQMHGLGLYIIEKITKQYHILYETKQGANFYEVILAVPLAHSVK